MSGLRPPSTPRSSISSSSSSNLPAPGSTPSSLPTPRRKSNAAQLGRHLASTSSISFGKTSEELNSLKDAMKRNDPGRYDSPDILAGGGGGLGGLDNSPTPSNLNSSIVPGSTHTPDTRKRTALRRPSIMNMKSTLTKSISRPATPSGSSNFTFPIPNTPTHPQRSKTPTGFGSSVSARPSFSAVRKLEIGDAVKMDVGGVSMLGIMRFLGEVTGKEGIWGGVELDPEWAGQGKNDGSVKGDQYFACPPLCGLFLPLSKISASVPLLRQSRPASSMSAHSDVSSKLTAGSRASKYVGVTAKELAAKKAAVVSNSSPTKHTPRKSMSPEKLALSKSVGMSTPRATARPRASIGGALSSFSLSTPRPSIVAPRNTLGASLRRPPSSLRNHAPEVPAIPTTFAGGRSIASSSISGRATPSTPGTNNRRLSTATDHSLNQSSRPATPSMRSVSRQSFASSLSRQSHVSNSSYGGDQEDELREARENEIETRKLLEGSERLGREMEDKLAEREDALKDALRKVMELETDRVRLRVLEEARLAEAGDEGAKERDLLRIQELEVEKESLLQQASTSKTASEKLAREWETKFAVRQGDIDSLRERMAEASRVSEVERTELTKELDRLRGAGQALCAEYEGRISEIEGARQDSVELAESLAAQLSQLTESIPGSPNPSSNNRLTISQASSHASAADIIDAENALAELEHTKIRLMNVEEQLEETRMHLESEIADSRRKKQKIIEVETMWKKETKTLRDTINSSSVGEARVSARILELEEALVESQITLENERSELEVLRHELNASPGLSNSSDINQQTSRHIHSTQGERDHSSRELEEARKELARNNELIRELRQDLKLAEKELDRTHMTRNDRSGSLFANDIDGSGTTDLLRRDRLTSLRIDNNTPTTQDTPNYHTSPTGKRDSVISISNSSRGGKDEATAIREQIVGLKMIISTLTEENQQMADRNKSLMNEAQELRDAQRALEATVENLMTELGNTPPSAALKERRASSDLLSSVPLQREVNDLKRKLEESDLRAQREIKSLNQEVTELESLVESKIYREDELETELARYKSLSLPSAHESLMNGAMGDDQECEMCGEKGHDLETCPIFGGVEAPIKRSSHAISNPSEFCDDCEEYGHSLEACPLANEIF